MSSSCTHILLGLCVLGARSFSAVEGERISTTKVGCTLHVLATAQQVLPFAGDKQQIGLHNVVVGQLHIAGGVEELSEPAVDDVVAELVSEQAPDTLVVEVRGQRP